MFRKVAFSLLLVLAVASAASASVIDFETYPDGTPTHDGDLITNQYAATFGVTFELLGQTPGIGPRIAKVGPPMTAFEGPPVFSRPACGIQDSTRSDTPASGAAGCTFLTDDGAVMAFAYILRIRYVAPVNEASGDIVDVDGNEVWVVTARRADESAIQSLTLTAQAIDGALSHWSFHVADPIAMIDFEQIGSTVGVGLAFDNFSPASCGRGRMWNDQAGDHDWNTAANWDPEGVPDPCDSVTITHGSVRITSDGAAARTVVVGGGAASCDLEIQNHSLTVERDFALEGGALHLVNGAVVDGQTFGLAGGQLDGSGTIHGDVVHTGGRISPGHSPGSITIDGNYTMSAGAKLAMQVGDLDAGEWDTLRVTGAATLAGVLDLEFLPGVEPSVGDLYHFIESGSRDGVFDSLRFSGGSSGGLYHVVYTDTSMAVALDSDFSGVGADPAGTAAAGSRSAILRFTGHAGDDGGITFEFGLAREATVRLDLFNVTGQCIATLRQGTETAGAHGYTLRRASNGETIASGLYFGRLEVTSLGAREVRTARIPLVR